MVDTRISPPQIDLQTIYRHLPIALCLIGRDGRLLVVNEVHAQLAGRRVEQLVGLRVADLHPQGGKNVERDFRHFDRGATVPDHELEIRGRIYMVSTSPVIDPEGKVLAISVAHLDITDKKQMELKNQRMTRDLRDLATRDHLTGAYNRREFDRILRDHCKSLRRTGQEFSLILFDIDHFKSFNDLHGHQMGDRCLRRVVKASQRALKNERASLFRYGGEEFAIVVAQYDPAGLIDIAERVRFSVRRLSIAHPNGEDGYVTVSCGLANTLQLQRPTPDLHSAILRAADNALYSAKKNGRDRVEVFEALRDLTSLSAPARLSRA
jgi:diguanylate cyclase (GGDEF)-like protein/PAS domain S-box-containing protein